MDAAGLAGSSCGVGRAQRRVGGRRARTRGAPRTAVDGPAPRCARPARADRPAGRGDPRGRWGGGRTTSPRGASRTSCGPLARSPDPDLALRALDRLAGANAREWTACEAALRGDVVLRGRLFALLGGSTALGDHLVSHPDRWRRLTAAAPDACTDVATRTATLLTAVGADPDGPPAGAQGAAAATLRDSEAVNALRTAYRDEMLALAAADLAAVSEPSLPVLPLEDVAAQLADLATAALRAALAVALAETDGEPGRLAVIAMGKTGGAELNYVSDVDVVFVAEPRDPRPPAWPRRMMRIAGEACFPVDANLRPEGRQGALVRTLDGHVAYYKRWAKTWEFQALLKARPVAGDPDAGQGLRRGRRPDGVDGRGPARLRRGRAGHAPPRRGARAARTTPTASSSWAAAGCATSSSPSSCSSSCTAAPTPRCAPRRRSTRWPRWPSRGYVGRDDGANLAASYRFLRLLEHRLQLQRMRRTHLLPAEDDTDALRWLARAAKLRPDGRHDAVGVLLEEWRRNARRVRRLHEKLFYRPLLDAVSRVSDDRASPPEAATVRLGALGWASPEGALHHIRALTGGVSRAAAIQKTLLPVLLDELARTPDPDRGLLAYRRVSEALARTPWYLRLLRDEGLVAERLMRLLGHLRAGPGPARARAGGAAAARRTGRRATRRADPRPGERRRDPAHRGRPPARPARRRDHRPLGPPPRDAPDRVRGPARQDGRRAGLQRALGGLGRGAAGRARLRAARARRVDAARPARRDRHGPAGRR